MVCAAGPRAGDLYGDLGSIHLQLWDLLQAGRVAGEEAVMAVDLLFWGIFVFAALLIGLVLTVMEFRKLE